METGEDPVMEARADTNLKQMLRIVKEHKGTAFEKAQLLGMLAKGLEGRPGGDEAKVAFDLAKSLVDGDIEMERSLAYFLEGEHYRGNVPNMEQLAKAVQLVVQYIEKDIGETITIQKSTTTNSDGTINLRVTPAGLSLIKEALKALPIAK
jgi:hypothetical protein